MMPASVVSRPATNRSSVVLPAPVGPSRTTNSPLGTVRLTSFTASTPPKRLVTRSMTTSATCGLFEQATLQRAPRDSIEDSQAFFGEPQADVFAVAQTPPRWNARFHHAVLGMNRNDLHGTHILDSVHLAS